jgi:hypothetical protein
MFVPSQFSGTSHTSVAARQTVPALAAGPLGHIEDVPLQKVSWSQSPPLDVWQRVPAFPAGCWQATLAPSHSSFVHGFPSSVHAVPDGFLASGRGQVGDRPSQFSATSHSPAAARQTVPAFVAGPLGHVGDVPLQRVSWSQSPPLDV